MKISVMSAILVGATTAFAGPATKRCSPGQIIPNYLSNDKSISYVGQWTQLKDQGSRDEAGVEAYSNDPSAYYDLLIPGGESYLEIWAGKKSDRGYFEVYIDDQLIGTGDAYDANCLSDCQSTLTFGQALTGYPDGALLTVRNRQTDERLGKTPFLDLNQVVFRPSNC